jgi:hypothetical protein
MSVSPFIIQETPKGWTVTWPTDKFVPIHTRDGFDKLIRFLFEKCDVDIARLMIQRLDGWDVLYIDSLNFYQNYQGYLADAIQKRHVVLGVIARTKEEADKIAECLDKQLVWSILKD